MDAILNFLSRATGRNVDVETVETTIIFCGIGLLVLLLFLTYGLDLSPEFIWQKARRRWNRRAWRHKTFSFWSNLFSEREYSFCKRRAGHLKRTSDRDLAGSIAVQLGIIYIIEPLGCTAAPFQSTTVWQPERQK
jgi:hypothetical protein